MDLSRGERMKIRLEIMDDDGTKKANVEFYGKHWKECLLKFIESIENTQFPSAGSSSQNLPTQPQQSFFPAYQPYTQNMQPSHEYMIRHNQAYNPPYLQQYSPHHMQSPPQQNPPPVNFQQNYTPYQQPYMFNTPQNQVNQSNVQNIPQNYHHQQQYYQNYNPGQQINSQPPVNNNYQHNVNNQQRMGINNPQQPITKQNQQPEVFHSQVNQASTVQQQTSQGTKTKTSVSLKEKLNDATLTINERLELFLKYEYPRVWFTSQDIQQHYERIYGNIKLSTVSTYLSRMYRKQLLERRGNRNQRQYRYIADEDETQTNNSSEFDAYQQNTGIHLI
ncbi:transcriptional repressor, CopY family [Methanosalsum zhilinae DSM 4017]|uniref:Transcriptional repressor, CopY family n=1 Tax=Methanosalsum zhilinae (strain DSM 4017 / NBRC 107636 / OCM 62 / WeN5) TaxID=679901 RepID=F7XP50_METZD|nr:hypothetical protein [Methanosalsum zhilinae]AEH61342.1 transcriptional repressor, CopY family [Methanosalsum zhilinae DSM 4017]